MIIFKTPQGVSLPLFIMNFILLQKKKKKKNKKREGKKKEWLLKSHLVIQSEILPKYNIIGPKGC